MIINKRAPDEKQQEEIDNLVDRIFSLSRHYAVLTGRSKKLLGSALHTDLIPPDDIFQAFQEWVNERCYSGNNKFLNLNPNEFCKDIPAVVRWRFKNQERRRTDQYGN